MRLFALSGSEALGAAIARYLEVDLDAHEERDFEDGEHKARPRVSVRGHDVFIVHSVAGTEKSSANDKLCKLLFFIAACKSNGAKTVSAITPYLPYSRKDRQTKSRDPVTTRYIAQLFEAVGADRVVALDTHNLSAFQNSFRCETVHLDSRRLFCPIIRELAANLPLTIFSPDGGGIKRAQLLKEMLENDSGVEAGFGLMEKRRSRGAVTGELFAGEVKGTAVIIIDDMISTGGTMSRAAEACRSRGAQAVFAIATHALFSKTADALLLNHDFDRIVVCDTISAAAKAKIDYPQARLTVVPTGPLFGEAIKRLSKQGSISDLLGFED